MIVREITKEQLSALPSRPWNHTRVEYDSLLIFSSDELHDSGWNCITIIGCINNQPAEICTTSSDDIEWKTNEVRTDCTPSGILHFWSSTSRRFLVSEALSSITITQTKPK